MNYLPSHILRIHRQTKSPDVLQSILRFTGRQLMLLLTFSLLTFVRGSVISSLDSSPLGRLPTDLRNVALDRKIQLEEDLNFKTQVFLKCVSSYPWECFDHSEGHIFGTPCKAKNPEKVAFIEKILCLYVSYKLTLGNRDYAVGFNDKSLREMNILGNSRGSRCKTAPELYETLLAQFMTKFYDCREYVLGQMPEFQDTENMEGEDLIQAAKHVLKWFQLSHKYETFERTSLVEDTLCGDDYICTTGSMFLKCIMDLLLPNGKFILRSGSICWTGHMILSLETEDGPVFIESVMAGFQKAKTSLWTGAKIRFYGLGMKIIQMVKSKYQNFNKVLDGSSIAHYLEQDLCRSLIERGSFVGSAKEQKILTKLMLRVLYSEWKKNGVTDEFKAMNELLGDEYMKRGPADSPSETDSENTFIAECRAKRSKMSDFKNKYRIDNSRSFKERFNNNNMCAECCEEKIMCRSCINRFTTQKDKWCMDALVANFSEGDVNLYNFFDCL